MEACKKQLDCVMDGTSGYSSEFRGIIFVHKNTSCLCHRTGICIPLSSGYKTKKLCISRARDQLKRSSSFELPTPFSLIDGPSICDLQETFLLEMYFRNPDMEIPASHP